MLSVPVVFIIFRRPDVTQRVFEQIARAKPKQLFVIADGARNDAEWADCHAARDIIEQVDWDCEIHKNYANHNMGLRQRIVSGLNWVFEQVEEAIILEDDCLPDPSFFRFCAELLEYYRDNQRVMHISGINIQPASFQLLESYYFSRYAHVWGWATWRRAWKAHDPEMALWQSPQKQEEILQQFSSANERRYWKTAWDGVLNGTIQTWDYPWVLTLIHSGCVSIIPGVNLVTNLGFGITGTNTRDSSSLLAHRSIVEMPFPLRHPQEVIIHQAADEFSGKVWYQRRSLLGRYAYAIMRRLMPKR